jgi:hypothetical protein
MCDECMDGAVYGDGGGRVGDGKRGMNRLRGWHHVVVQTRINC